MSDRPKWPKNVRWYRKGLADFDDLDHTERAEVAKGIMRVAVNPKPDTEGGYGHPLSGALEGLCKVKFRKSGIRVVYRYVKSKDGMFIIVVAMRGDDEVYRIAESRLKEIRHMPS